MIPFVRTTLEAAKVVELLKKNGLERGKDGLRIIMMCELPSNAILADDFLQYFDGFSIGSNDLTQLTLGMDRDSGLIADSFDERNDAVKKLITMAIEACHRQDKYIGICGQGPSDHMDFAQWLLEDFELNGETIMVAPAAGFYSTKGLGLNQVRIAYVLKQEDLIASVNILKEALKQYNG